MDRFRIEDFAAEGQALIKKFPAGELTNAEILDCGGKAPVGA